MVRFRCPSCNKSYTAPPKYAGKRKACKRCGNVVTIPGPAPQVTVPVRKPAPTYDELSARFRLDSEGEADALKTNEIQSDIKKSSLAKSDLSPQTNEYLNARKAGPKRPDQRVVFNSLIACGLTVLACVTLFSGIYFLQYSQHKSDAARFSKEMKASKSRIAGLNRELDNLKAERDRLALQITGLAERQNESKGSTKTKTPEVSSSQNESEKLQDAWNSFEVKPGLTHLPINFGGHEVEKVIDELIAVERDMPSKGQFETRAEFQKRKSSAFANLDILDNKKKISDYLIFVTESALKYDVENGEYRYEISQDQRVSRSGYIGESYLASNAFGVQRRVQESSTSIYSIVDKTPGSDDWDVYGFQLAFAMPRKRAQELGDKLAVVAVTKIASPEVETSHATKTPTLNSPTRESLRYYTLKVEVHDHWIFRKDTGEILQKWSEYQRTITAKKVGEEILKTQKKKWRDLRADPDDRYLYSGEEFELLSVKALRDNLIQFTCYEFENGDEYARSAPGKRVVGFAKWDPDSEDRYEKVNGWVTLKEMGGEEVDYSLRGVIRKWLKNVRIQKIINRRGLE